jgi:hypothetical protein
LNRRLCAIARFARSVFLPVVNLGFRCAPPQALCFHALRGFWKDKPELAQSEIPRLTFAFADGDATEVNFEDYH